MQYTTNSQNNSSLTHILYHLYCFIFMVEFIFMNFNSDLLSVVSKNLFSSLVISFILIINKMVRLNPFFVIIYKNFHHSQI